MNKYERLTFLEREEISRQIASGHSIRDIAKDLNRAPSSISREVQRNGQSVYRLNGRRISRTHILEVLSVAGISSTSQNCASSDLGLSERCTGSQGRI